MKLIRALLFVALAGLLSLNMGNNGCVVGIFGSGCDSDIDCFDDEFCDFDGICVPGLFLEDSDCSDGCLIESDESENI